MNLFKKENYDGILRQETYIYFDNRFISQKEFEEVGYYAIQKMELCELIDDLESKQYIVKSNLDFDNGDFLIEATKQDTTKDMTLIKRFKLRNIKVK